VQGLKAVSGHIAASAAFFMIYYDIITL
jgi:hypothetical protein